MSGGLFGALSAQSAAKKSAPAQAEVDASKDSGATAAKKRRRGDTSRASADPQKRTVAQRRASELLVIDTAADVDPPLQEAASAGNDASCSGAMPMDAYASTQKNVLRAVMNAAAYDDRRADSVVETREAERDAMSTRAAFTHAQMRRTHVNGAALTNDLVRKAQQRRDHLDAVRGVTGERERAVHVIEGVPYTREAKSAFARIFINKVVERTPEDNAYERVPTDEMRQASEPILYDYMVAYMRTARPGVDFACCYGAQCFGRRLLDERREPLRERTTWAVFWRPDEEREVRRQPERWSELARTRPCIGCKLERINNSVLSSMARNVTTSADCVRSDIHVFVNMVGEFPAEATIGPGFNRHHGLYANVPRITRVGWSAERDPSRDGCYVYQWDVPRYPVPTSYYEQQSAHNHADDADDAPSHF